MKEYYAHPTAVIDEPCTIGRGSKIWHFCHLMQNCTLGKNCNIGQNVVVSPQVILGDGCKVQNNVSLYTGLTCEAHVFIGPSAVFTNVRNPRAAVNRRGSYEATHLDRGVTIGANATIVCGISIGAYAFIGAGAVVTKNVPAYALMVGNPARQTGWISEKGYKIKFDKQGRATCPESGEEYLMENHKVHKIAENS